MMLDDESKQVKTGNPMGWDDRADTTQKLVDELHLVSECHPSVEMKGLADSENPLDPVNRVHCLLKMFLNAHSGFSRDDLQAYFTYMPLLSIHLVTIWKKLSD